MPSLITPSQVRASLFAEALKWEGVRWVHLGRTYKGIDCVGLILLVGRDLDIMHYDPGPYPKRPDGSFLIHFQTCLIEKPVSNIEIGDVVTFNDQGHPCHCGIIGEKWGEPSVVHAHIRRRSVIHERLTEAKSIVGVPARAFKYREDL